MLLIGMWHVAAERCPLIPIERTGDEEADVRALTIKITEAVENAIRQYPGQWLWIHKRWKTRPPGEPAIY